MQPLRLDQKNLGQIHHAGLIDLFLDLLLAIAGVAERPASNGSALAGQQTRPFISNVGRSASSPKAGLEASFLEMKDAPCWVVVRLLGNFNSGAPYVRLHTSPSSFEGSL